MWVNMVKRYLNSTIKAPYFIFISDTQYLSVIEELKICGLNIISMSDFCSNYDKIPDIDELYHYIDESKNADCRKFVVTGLGEFLALQGYNEAICTFSILKDYNTGGAKVILALRGMASLIPFLISDPRFDDRRHIIIDGAECEISLTLVTSSIPLSAIKGYKSMLKELEKGKSGNIVVNTAVNMEQAIFTVHQISNAYEGIKFLTRGFTLACSCGSDALWEELLSELNLSGGSFDVIYKKYGYVGNLVADFYNRISGNDFSNWLYFICLKMNSDILNNSYLCYVLNNTYRFDDFIHNVLNYIIEIFHTDKQFSTFYRERKELIKDFPESDIADFVINNRKIIHESIYKLTDNTKVEREEIIAWISENGIIPQLDEIYPLLAAYLKKYVFRCSELSDMLSNYFDDYKRQKIRNQIEPHFLERVNELALSRKFNLLPTRNEIIDKVNQNDTYLYWLDALGVEYLSMIECLVQKKGLSMRVSIARAELPTITSINREFYDNWQGYKKEKNDELDKIKHKEDGGYNYEDNQLPIHLAKELDIIKEVIDKAATELAFRHCKRFLIVSDHGASRLAVLRRKIEKYNTDTKGIHSGRCCKVFHPYDLPFATEENGYIVLADYGRFEGSRAANVEVHGGASLEEVIIPIIELSLRDYSIMVKLVDEEIIVDSRNGAVINLFLNTTLNDIYVIINGKSYRGEQIDNNHFKVKLDDIKRAGVYQAEVYTGDNLISQIIIKAQGKIGKINNDFNDLFDLI